MAEIQTLQAALGLARSALKVADLVRQLYNAKEEADDLYCKVKHLHTISRNVYNVLRERSESHPRQNWSSAEIDVHESIEYSLRESRRCLLVLRGCLMPLNTTQSGEGHNRLASRIEYVFDKPMLNRQAETIKTNINMLTTNLILLQMLDKDKRPEILHPICQLNQAIAQDVARQEAVIIDELPKDERDAIVHDADAVGPSESSHDENEDVQHSDSELDINKGCSKCRKRNNPVPDSELTLAVKYGKPVIVKYWIEAGSDVGVLDKDDWTLLHHASHRVDYETIRCLMDSPKLREAQLMDARTRNGQTALMHVAGQVDATQSHEVAEVLIRSGCDVNITDSSEENRSALYLALDGSKTKERQRFIELLINNGADVSSVADTLPEKCKAYEVLQQKSKDGQQRQRDTTQQDEGGMSPPSRKTSFSTAIGRKLSKVLTKDSGSST